MIPLWVLAKLKLGVGLKLKLVKLGVWLLLLLLLLINICLFDCPKSLFAKLPPIEEGGVVIDPKVPGIDGVLNWVIGFEGGVINVFVDEGVFINNEVGVELVVCKNDGVVIVVVVVLVGDLNEKGCVVAVVEVVVGLAPFAVLFWANKLKLGNVDKLFDENNDVLELLLLLLVLLLNNELDCCWFVFPNRLVEFELAAKFNLGNSLFVVEFVELPKPVNPLPSLNGSEVFGVNVTLGGGGLEVDEKLNKDEDDDDDNVGSCGVFCAGGLPKPVLVKLKFELVLSLFSILVSFLFWVAPKVALNKENGADWFVFVFVVVLLAIVVEPVPVILVVALVVEGNEIVLDSVSLVLDEVDGNNDENGVRLVDGFVDVSVFEFNDGKALLEIVLALPNWNGVVVLLEALRPLLFMPKVNLGNLLPSSSAFLSLFSIGLERILLVSWVGLLDMNVSNGLKLNPVNAVPVVAVLPRILLVVFSVSVFDSVVVLVVDVEVGNLNNDDDSGVGAIDVGVPNFIGSEDDLNILDDGIVNEDEPNDIGPVEDKLEVDGRPNFIFDGMLVDTGILGFNDGIDVGLFSNVFFEPFGLSVIQHTHWVLSASFETRHVSHVHLEEDEAVDEDKLDKDEVVLDFGTGLGVAQHAHLSFESVFWTKHVSHVHLEDGEAEAKLDVEDKEFENGLMGATALTETVSCEDGCNFSVVSLVSPCNGLLQLEQTWLMEDCFIVESFDNDGLVRLVGVASPLDLLSSEDDEEVDDSFNNDALYCCGVVFNHLQLRQTTLRLSFE